MSENAKIKMPPFCERHQSRLIHGAKFGRFDPWRALTVVAQIAMFQIASTRASIQKKLGGDITRFSELGCIACKLPAAFDEVINAAKSHDLGQVKALGEKYVSDAAV